MGDWRYEIDLSAAYARYYEDENLEAIKTETVERIRCSSAYQDEELRPDLERFCEELSEVEDPDEWDDVYAGLYDFCDVVRIWLRSQP